MRQKDASPISVGYANPPLPMQPKCHINALPVELLSFIFVLATHESTDPENTIPFNSESVKIPLIFSAVNRHWRSVSLETSALWTSLCATVGSIEHTSFNTSHFTSYLRLSRRYPIDVLIDARDQNWDFSEPEIPSAYEYSTYVPPFSGAHMDTVMSLLLPHLSRWRSFVVLTDTWAPMHNALFSLNSTLSNSAAPLLESLILMRCNEYVSHSPEFQPPALKSPAFLDFKVDVDVFPRLRQLSLRGVHVDWSYLPKSCTSLTSLEMSSHSPDVRPPLHDFYNILSTTTYLRRLVIHGSGPLLADNWPEETRIPDSYIRALSLHSLEELVVGYRSVMDSINLFEMLDIPNIKSLTLEDATHPGDIDDIDAGPLLIYLAEGERPVHVETVVIWSLVNGHVSRPQERKTERTSSVGDGEKKPLQPRKLLAQLDHLTLNRVKAHSQNFQYLFLQLTSLKRLELSSTSLDPINALIPGRSHMPFALNEPQSSSCPCPQLSSLIIRNFDANSHPNPSTTDFDRMVSNMNTSREKFGANQVEQVDFYVSCSQAREWAIQQFIETSDEHKLMPNFQVMGPGFEDEIEYGYDPYDSDRESLYEEDAFQLGGAFNDPLFDAYYGSRFSVVS